ncbi:MAG: hypothetical protein LUH58_03305 [Lachnospiraceae bacterium]|nr:hypothetical protein [Lachnospiraceae bacterium]
MASGSVRQNDKALGVPEKLGAEYYREFLTRQGKEVYDRVNAQLLEKDYSGTSTFLLSDPAAAAADCFAAYRALRDDHPEYFFLGLECRFSRLGSVGTMKYPILYSEENIGQIQLQLRKYIYQIVRGTAYMDDIEGETTVYERIAQRMTYENNNDMRDHNICGPVLFGSGVCEGQNALLLLCLRRIRVPCIKVCGRTDTDGSHCWAVAWIKGEPAHCDVTWEKSAEGNVWFDYLNLSDRQISANHYSFRSGRCPECRTGRFSYYQYHGLCVHSPAELYRMLRQQAASDMPLRIHFEYRPLTGSLLNEIKSAFFFTGINAERTVYAHPDNGNVMII